MSNLDRSKAVAPYSIYMRACERKRRLVTPPQEENRREAVLEMGMGFFGVAGADGCQECHSGWIGRSCTLVDAFGCWDEATGVWGQ